MALADLRREVAAANRDRAAAGLASLSFGNASGLDRGRGVMVIKASGIPCAEVTPDRTVVVSLEDGSVVEGSLTMASRPSTTASCMSITASTFPAAL